MKKILTLCFLLNLFSAQGQTDTGVIIKNKIHFDLTDSSSIKAISEVLSGSKIIGMGEATHGSSEFIRARSTICKNLVEHYGYRLISLEADFADVYLLNRYITRGEGIEDSLIAGLKFWMYQCDEYRELFDWMREYNKNKEGKDQVKLYGNDVQFSLNASILLAKYLKSADFKGMSISTLEEIKDEFAAMEKIKFYKKYFTELKKAMVLDKDELIKKTSLSEYQLHLLFADKLIFETRANAKGKPAERDYCMYLMAKKILDYEKEQKIIVWAHDGHVSNGNDDKGMGYYFKKQYNQDYYCLGLIFKEGGANAVDGLHPHEGKGPGSFFVSRANFTAKILDINDDYFLNLRNLGISALSKKYKYPTLGAVYFPDSYKQSFSKMNLNKEFDGVVYFRTVHASHKMAHSK